MFLVYMKLEKVVHYVQYAPPIISLYLQLEHQQNLLRDRSRSKKETSIKIIRKLKRIIKAMNWKNVYSQEDAQSAFLNIQRNIIESFNACCPIQM